MPRPPTLEHACDLTVELGPVRELGDGRAGTRRIVPIVGGTVRGPLLSGTILPIGADWQTVFRGGTAEVHARYAFETDDGALIEIVNGGFRHGPADVMARLAAGHAVASADYYMRTQARLETGDARYDWVNGTVFVGSGARAPAAVTISLYAVR